MTDDFDLQDWMRHAEKEDSFSLCKSILLLGVIAGLVYLGILLLA